MNRKIFKKSIILFLLLLTMLSAFKDISLGIYFGVLTNLIVNIFFTANILKCENNENNKVLINENRIQ
jgi:hypothetical protein